MIQILLRTLGSLAMKVAMLIAATNLLFRALQGTPFSWNGLLELEGLPDRFFLVVGVAWNLLCAELRSLV